MKNKPKNKYEFDVNCGFEQLVASSIEDLVAKVKAISAAHPDARLNIGVIVLWSTIDSPNDKH